MIRTYFNQRAAIWDKTVAENDRTKLERMASRLNIKPGSSVLDIGSGTGIFIPYLLDHIGQTGKLIALDIAEEMLKVAKAKGFMGDIEYLCADVTNLPVWDETFTVVVCYSSFPHFQDKLKALREMNRVLENSGRLFICHTLSRTQVNEIHRSIPAVRDDTIPDEDEMKALLQAAGFTNIRIEDQDDSYLVSARKP